MNQEAGETAKPSGPPRRSGARRRGGRGRRRPERREDSPPQSQAPSSVESPAPASIADKPTQAPELVSQPQRHQPKQSNLSPIAAATEHVEQIIQTLKDSLRELEEILEILDDAQRQQIGDSKEIEKLRRSLSMLQRERSSIPPREDSRGRFENRGRSENRNRPEPRPESSGEEAEE